MTVETHREKPLRLALIGMSGAGKTFWTKKLTAAGYPGVSCDDRIEQKLAPRLAAGGHAGINGVGAGMGWPGSATYTQSGARGPVRGDYALAAPNDDRASRGFRG